MFPHVSGLTSEVPDLELEIFVHNSLYIEPDGGDGGNNLTELQLVEDCSLTSGIQT